MRERLAALRRLSTVYQMLEEMHSVEARRAYAAVLEAQSAILATEARTHEARTGGREALLMDDRTGRSLAVVHEAIADQRKKQLEPLLEERELMRVQARQRYFASRLSSERMKSLIDTAAARVATEEERRAQAREDDRFLARRAWMNRTRRDIRQEK
jgi:hypothetical protein